MDGHKHARFEPSNRFPPPGLPQLSRTSESSSQSSRGDDPEQQRRYAMQMLWVLFFCCIGLPTLVLLFCVVVTLTIVIFWVGIKTLHVASGATLHALEIIISICWGFHHGLGWVVWHLGTRLTTSLWIASFGGLVLGMIGVAFTYLDGPWRHFRDHEEST
ncbi:hypothetical protein B0T13DRAFT_465311, partial [Neurospora crassa]